MLFHNKALIQFTEGRENHLRGMVKVECRDNTGKYPFILFIDGVSFVYMDDKKRESDIINLKISFPELKFIKNYHVCIPYYHHYYVGAEDKSGAVENAHNSTGTMGEYDEHNIFVEEV